MECNVRISGVEPESIVDGPGFRYTVFTQGCPHNCPGCHNPQTHPFEGGKVVDIHTILADVCENPLLMGITLSGGEPFCQPAPLAELARMAHEKGLDVVTFTGYLYEQLLAKHDPAVDDLLAQTDLLIDGPFVLAEKDLTLRFRGSRNQRVIDMNATRSSGSVVLADY